MLRGRQKSALIPVCVAILVLVASASSRSTEGVEETGATTEKARPDASFFASAAFVSIDFQPPVWRDEPLPRGFAELGITQADVDEARRRLVEIALPNARRVADASRRLGLPMIFVHWGYRFADAVDLDPSVYNAFLDNYGPDTSTWPHHISHEDSRPADELGVRPGEYVIAKTAQDAFASSNIGFVLENLGIENIVFVGGDTGACLGNSARSAIAAGFRVLCVEDATFDASEQRRLEMLPLIGCHYSMTTEDFEILTEEILTSQSVAGLAGSGAAGR
jgi:nicotinamidase-related amidase